MADFVIVGGGLAGCECALVLAGRGHRVVMYEQKPHFRSEAHATNHLAELVCSNSFRSAENTSGIGLLKNEMRALNSPFMRAADNCRIPAGKAQAVDRELFSLELEEGILASGLIELIHKRVESIDDLKAAHPDAVIIIAAGPMASEGLINSLSGITGHEQCYFYDAIAPIIWTESVNMDIAFRASRYGVDSSGEGDYINCPMSRDEYELFYAALCAGKIFNAHNEKHFEGCMPIEALAARGLRTLVYGPMKPVGLTDPATGKRPWAVLQLRPEKANMETCNMVGCQTKLLQSEQKRIFSLVPGLENAEFARYGSMHRNTYLNAPLAMNADFSLIKRPDTYVIGQLSGVEGYVESAATGLWLGLYLDSRARGHAFDIPPEETAMGALFGHLRRKVKNFQPSNAHFGLMPAFEERIVKKERKQRYATRAEASFRNWLNNLAL